MCIHLFTIYLACQRVWSLSLSFKLRKAVKTIYSKIDKHFSGFGGWRKEVMNRPTHSSCSGAKTELANTYYQLKGEYLSFHWPDLFQNFYLWAGNGGPRSQVYASKTLCLAPHRNEQKISGAYICTVTFKHITQPLNSYRTTFGNTPFIYPNIV
jgi:hypothetical protein